MKPIIIVMPADSTVRPTSMTNCSTRQTGLYIATGEQSYLDKATSYIPNLGKELGSDELKYSWGMCWDDVMQGGLLLYAINTNDSFYIGRVQKHLNYWTDSVKTLDGGLQSG